MPAQGLDDRLGRQGGDAPLLLLFPGEGAPEHEIGNQAARDGRVARTRELSRLQQALLSGLDFFRAETLGERFAELFGERRLDPRAVLRRVDREESEAAALEKAVGRQERADAVGEALVLADAPHQTRVGRAAEKIVAEEERRIIGVVVAQPKEHAGAQY